MELYRELVGLNRDAYQPNLATSVTNLPIRLAEAGQRSEGLTAAQEAATPNRELARTDHDVFGPAAERADNLVTALSNDSF